MLHGRNMACNGTGDGQAGMPSNLARVFMHLKLELTCFARGQLVCCRLRVSAQLGDLQLELLKLADSCIAIRLEFCYLAPCFVRICSTSFQLRLEHSHLSITLGHAPLSSSSAWLHGCVALALLGTRGGKVTADARKLLRRGG